MNSLERAKNDAVYFIKQYCKGVKLTPIQIKF